MAMRNPPVSDVLRRRLFMTASPYTRRDAAGIMASSSPLMEAQAKANQRAEQAQIIPAGLVSSISGAASEPAPLPISTETPTQPAPFEFQTPSGSTSTSSAKNDDAAQKEALKKKGNIEAAHTASAKEKKEEKNKKKEDETLTSIDLNKDQSSLIVQLLGGETNIDKLIKKNKDLLDKYAPAAKKPDEKRRAFTDFFLRMAAQGAAGEGVVAAAGKSAQPAFEGYMKREDEARAEKEKRDMLGLTLGLQEAQKEEAARQALGLKMLENKDPATLKLAKAIQADAASRGEEITLEEAVQRSKRQSAPGFQLAAFQAIQAKYPELDPAVITQLVTGGISISDLALGIGKMEDIQSILDEVLTATTQSDVVELD